MNSAKRSWLGDGLLLIATVIWALNFSAVHLAMETWGECQLTFLSARFALALLALAPVVVMRHRTHAVDVRPYIVPCALIAGSLAVAYSSQTAALALAEPGRVAFLTSLSIVLTPLAVVALRRREVRLREWIAVLVGTAGLALMTLQFGSPLRTGDLLAVLGAVALTADILLIGKYAKELDAVMLTWGTTLFLAIGYGAAALGFEIPAGVPAIDWRVVVGLVSAGIFATAIAFVLQTMGQKRTTEVRAAIVFNLEPVFASVFSITVLAEAFTPREAIGGLGIVAAAVIIEWPGKQQEHRRDTVD